MSSPYFLGAELDEARAYAALIGPRHRAFLVLAQHCVWGIIVAGRVWRVEALVPCRGIWLQIRSTGSLVRTELALTARFSAGQLDSLRDLALYRSKTAWSP